MLMTEAAEQWHLMDTLITVDTEDAEGKSLWHKVKGKWGEIEL